jgi:acylphosphatase
MSTSSKLVEMKFEVFGTVQKVFFRKYTQEQATKLNLTGFVENTPKGTVVGVAQGSLESINKLENWLKTTGSPKSTISHCNTQIDPLEKATFPEFGIRRKSLEKHIYK